MLPTAVGFSKSKRATDHYSLSAQDAVGFPSGLLKPWARQCAEGNIFLQIWNV